ncbi:hypothetical protein GUI43_04078 [Micromonospora noduli]|nr:hypothetical protein GUI43_04078 [Micromonospora noduli]RAO15224.1 hypothetical protein LUPAC07_03499 [Micromonospora noduli]
MSQLATLPVFRCPAPRLGDKGLLAVFLFFLAKAMLLFGVLFLILCPANLGVVRLSRRDVWHSSSLYDGVSLERTISVEFTVLASPSVCPPHLTSINSAF